MIFGLTNKIRAKLLRLAQLRGDIDMIRQALGRIEARQIAMLPPDDLAASHFKVSSQFGEDGIIEHLVQNIAIEKTIFVEFGVEDYSEANTRFLLRNRNWSGLIFDGSAENMAKVRNEAIYWKHNLKAECCFVTRENIDRLISGHGIRGDIGLLSIDIDGNDYWVWEAISCISPRIVIVEYNHSFGATAKVSVPYDPDFIRPIAHYSGLYYGGSLATLAHLGERKGYILVGTEAMGCNAFFIRRDVAGQFKARTAEEAFTTSSIRQSRDPNGQLNFLPAHEARSEIADMPLVDVVTGATLKVADLPPMEPR